MDQGKLADQRKFRPGDQNVNKKAGGEVGVRFSRHLVRESSETAALGSAEHWSLLEVQLEADRQRKKLSLLTRREQQVYEQLLLAKSNKEISSALNITESTVRFHVSNVLHKLGVFRRIEILAKNWH